MKKKEYFTKIINQKRAQIEKLEKEQIECDDKDTRAQLGATLVSIRGELEEAEQMLADVENEEKQKETEEKAKEENENEHEEVKERKLTILGSYSSRGENMEDMEKRQEKLNKILEARGKALKEKRAVTVEAGDLLLPNHQGTQLNDTFTQVSTLVDRVATETLQGGESYREAYVKEYGTGGITKEGEAYTKTEPKFGYAPMTKVKVTAYAEISEEVKKLPNIDYASKVQEACKIALKKKLSQQIINGLGVATGENKNDEMMGIFGNPVAIDSTKDKDITAIDVNTLNEIIFSFGGDEDTEANATLIINKKTLKQLSEVKKANGDPAYEIDLKNKTINTIPYIINSNVKDFESATDGEFIGAYGDLMAYKTPTFSPVEMIESSDYKFEQGMICYKASVFVAGNVVKQDGFLRLKKKTA